MHQPRDPTSRETQTYPRAANHRAVRTHVRPLLERHIVDKAAGPNICVVRVVQVQLGASRLEKVEVLASIGLAREDGVPWQHDALAHLKQLLELALGKLREARGVQLLLLLRQRRWESVSGELGGGEGVNGDEDGGPHQRDPQRPRLQRVVRHEPGVAARQQDPQRQHICHEESASEPYVCAVAKHRQVTANGREHRGTFWCYVEAGCRVGRRGRDGGRSNGGGCRGASRQ